MPAGRNSKGRKTRGWFSRDNRRAFGVCLLFGSAIVVAFGAVFPHAPTMFLRGAYNWIGSAPATQTDDDLATGSIIFVPVMGNVCRKRLIDNATWRIRDIGIVECRKALNANAPEPGLSFARVDVIRNSFSRR